MRKYYVTSESVTEGHPDKICDQVSDAILDAIISQDPKARVACETTCTTGIINVMGEITTSAYADIPKIARDVVLDIGYDSSDKGFDGHTCAVSTMIDEQSSDIAMGVDHSPYADDEGFDLDTGAGDQGMMYGYACDETPELMPLPISIAHALTKKLTEVRKDGTLEYLRPDGKSQVTIEYIDGKPNKIDTIVISTQHSDEISIEELRQDVYDEVILPVLYQYPSVVDVDGFNCYINPTGRFVIGGPHGDSGLTGRKIVVDTYGGVGRVGGGCFCFPAGTLVKTADGHKPIEQIQKGDKVWTITEKTNFRRICEVEDIFINTSYSDDIYDLELESDNHLYVTGNHEVLTANGWKHVCNLTLDDDILDFNYKKFRTSTFPNSVEKRV